MAAATLDLINTLAIEQNSFWSLWIHYPGNFPNAFLKAQLRADFDGQLLTDFRFDPGVYSAESGLTSFRMYLSSGQTRRLSPAPEGKPYRYDVLFYGPTGEPDRIIQGIATISPGVTE